MAYRKYPTCELFQEKIDEYFEENDYLSIAGLQRLLGFANKKSLTDYEKHGDDYKSAIKLAKLKIEEYHCKRLCEPKCVGSIFYLKAAFGYRDKSELEVTGEGLKVQIVKFKDK